jgi:ketosteroid isomerase-like protein
MVRRDGMRAGWRTGLLLVVALVAAGGCVRVRVARGGAGALHPEAMVSEDVVRREVQALLDHGASAWNRGDLEGFLSDYLPGTRTSFVTPQRVEHGITAIRERYQARYFAPGARRDSLAFEGLEVDQVGPGVVNAIAFYVLARGDSVVARGPTSLVLVRTGGRWFIVHDHSS